MSAAYATEHVSMSDQVTHDDVKLGAGVENAQTVARLLAEMEQVDLYIIDMKGRILPLWSSPHDLLSDVAAVLQQWNAAQPDMRAFFTSPVLAEVRALRRKYVRLERVAEALCQLMDLQCWIDGLDHMVRVRTENGAACMHKQRTLQQLTTDGVVSRGADYEGQSSVDCLLSSTRATLAVQQHRARSRLDRLASTDDESREEIADVDWTSETQQQVYEARWCQMRNNGNALLLLVDIRKAAITYDALQARCRDAEMSTLRIR